jgi:membrane-associated phospholipid phosphatase
LNLPEKEFLPVHGFLLYNVFVRGFFYDFFKNIGRIFFGRNLAWHFLAIVLTCVLVSAGFDWRYFQMTRNSVLQVIFWPAVVLGGFVPLFGIFTFFLISLVAKKKRLVAVAYALGQAAILGLLLSDFYKFFTGRPGPPEIFAWTTNIPDISHVFRFGILRGGVFWGWPSSHAAVAASMAAAIWALFPENKKLKFVAAAYALYIGLGVSMTIHWFSDFVAGLIFGAVVGTVVGKAFLKKMKYGDPGRCTKA